MKLIPLCLLLVITLPFASSKKCRSNSGKYKFLTGTIGTGSEDKPHFHFMECDTMYVKEGNIVNIKPHTYLAFKNPKPQNAIIVEGDLIILGIRSHKVSISSNIDTLLFSMESYNKPWQGIYVSETGALKMEKTLMYGALFPVKSMSREVEIKDSKFFGTKQIVMYKNRPLPLPSSKSISRFSLNNYLNKLNSGNFTYESKRSRKR